MKRRRITLKHATTGTGAALVALLLFTVPTGARASSATPPPFNVPRITFTPAIDGDLSAWEGLPHIFLGLPEDVFPAGARDQWSGPKDLSALLYAAWDETHLYLAAQVTDDHHINTRSGRRIFAGDSLQFAFLTRETTLVPFNFYLNLGLALTTEGLATYQWRGPNTGVLEWGEFAVKRDDELAKTFYEMRIPFDRLGILNPEVGTRFGFNAVFFDDDGEGNAYWIQIGPGLAGGWDPALFRDFVLENK